MDGGGFVDGDGDKDVEVGFMSGVEFGFVVRASAVYFEPGSGCGGWGKGTRRMVPMGVERVVLFLRVMMLPAASFTSGSVIVFMDA